eukprot:COSAG01_NODE_1159_length_11469_cov_15.000352_8_plen_333_part_00
MTVAVKEGYVGCVKALVVHGCPTIQPEGGFSALFEASRLGRTEVVETLLSLPGAEVDEVDLVGESPLMVATRAGQQPVVQCLLQRGAALEHRALHGVTPLMVAAGVGNVEAARLLLQRGAKVNAQDERRLTGLHFATREGHLDCLRLLLDWGATAFSNRNFSRQKLFEQPEWGPAAIRPAGPVRPGTAPVLSSPSPVAPASSSSFSVAAQVPPQRLRVDDLGAMSHWSTEVTGAATLGRRGLAGAVPQSFLAVRGPRGADDLVRALTSFVPILYPCTHSTSCRCPVRGGAMAADCAVVGCSILAGTLRSWLDARIAAAPPASAAARLQAQIQ